MGQPTNSAVHIDRPLTNISIAYLQNAENFVANRVFPNLGVSKQSDVFWKYNREDFNRDGMKKRAPATESAGGGYNLATDTYYCDVWALHKDIDDQTRANTDDPLSPDRDATNWLTHQFLISRERQFVSTAFTTSVWGTDVTGVSGAPGAGQVQYWSEAASTPIEDVETARNTVLQETGFEPNVIVLGQQVWSALKNHPDILDRIKYASANNNPVMVTRQTVAALFEVDELLVMKAIWNSGNEGATESNAFIGGKNALFCYRTPSAGLLTPTAGYTFGWTGFTGADINGTRMKRLRMENIESDRIEIQAAYDIKIVGTDLGYFFSGVVA